MLLGFLELSNEKFKRIGDSCSELEKLILLLPSPTWDAITSDAPRVLVFCPIQGLMVREDSSTMKMPMGRFRSSTKKTGTLSIEYRCVYKKYTIHYAMSQDLGAIHGIAIGCPSPWMAHKCA